MAVRSMSSTVAPQDHQFHNVVMYVITTESCIFGSVNTVQFVALKKKGATFEEPR